MSNIFSRRRRGCLIFILLGSASLLSLYLAISVWPSLGASGADVLRAMLGDRAVAKMEMLVFQAQDTLQGWKFDLGLIKPEAPWQVAALGTATPAGLSPTPTRGVTPEVQVDYSATNVPSPTPPSAQATNPPITPSPEPSPIPAPWMPAAVTPLGTLEGEGVWSPYIQDLKGRTVAYRTFLQPDKDRPYVVVAVIAFDLSHIHLHYVLGSVEPYNPDAPKRLGKIAAGDMLPGVLLATFNGGFKATHGQFGAMADGIQALPPRDGLGTLAIYKDNSVRMGEWGSEILPSADMVAWRQNGPLVVHNGQINPAIFDNSPKDWGYTVDDVSPTWRSGIGLNANRDTLYYFVGPKMTMPALADTMLAAGAEQGIQLDINNYWVHFVKILADGNQLKCEPLFPDSMSENVDRYLHPYTRDFFYITASP